MGQKAKPPSSIIIFAKYSKLFHWHILLKICNSLILCSHEHEYESGTVYRFPYEFRQTRVCVYFNGGRSHRYEYGLPVNFTRTSSFCAGRVFFLSNL